MTRLTSSTLGRIGSALAALTVTVVLGLLVWRFVHPDRFFMMMANISGAWLAIAIATFLVYQAARTLRVRALLEVRTSWVRLFSTICIQSLFNAYLPTGGGEAALLYLLKKRHEVAYYDGTALLIVVRLVDLAIFVGLFFLVSIWTEALFLLPRFAITGMVLFSVVLALLVAIAWVFLQSWQKRTVVSGSRHFLSRQVANLSAAFARVRERRVGATLAACSLIMWLAMFFFSWQPCTPSISSSQSGKSCSYTWLSSRLVSCRFEELPT